MTVEDGGPDDDCVPHVQGQVVASAQEVLEVALESQASVLVKNNSAINLKTLKLKLKPRQFDIRF